VLLLSLFDRRETILKSVSIMKNLIIKSGVAASLLYYKIEQWLVVLK
jgi:hypothetical protein